jgi:hypothetical protein
VKGNLSVVPCNGGDGINMGQWLHRYVSLDDSGSA